MGSEGGVEAFPELRKHRTNSEIFAPVFFV